MKDYMQVKKPHIIVDETRSLIIKVLLTEGSLKGDKTYHEVAKELWPNMSDKLLNDIQRHMDYFGDYSEDFYAHSIIRYQDLSDDAFIQLIEGCVNSVSFSENKSEIIRIVAIKHINNYLNHDGYSLCQTDQIGEKRIYKCISKSNNPIVSGSIKNIIFAVRYKPEIVFDDILNNSIRIVGNADQCILYSGSIPQHGLMWSELVEWYCQSYGITRNKEQAFIERMHGCLDLSIKQKGEIEGAETYFFDAYLELKDELKIGLPALIPQVYLYYDTKTSRERGYKLFDHQVMDFANHIF